MPGKTKWGNPKRKPRSSTLYKPGDFVFAKVRGYSHWPAKIFRILNQRNIKYRIYFYGSDQMADVGSEAIEWYNANTKKLYITKRLKNNKMFKKAISEIEKAMEDKTRDIAPAVFRYVMNKKGKSKCDSNIVEVVEGQGVSSEGSNNLLNMENTDPHIDEPSTSTAWLANKSGENSKSIIPQSNAPSNLITANNTVDGSNERSENTLATDNTSNFAINNNSTATVNKEGNDAVKDVNAVTVNIKSMFNPTHVRATVEYETNQENVDFRIEETYNTNVDLDGNQSELQREENVPNFTADSAVIKSNTTDT